MNERRVSEAVLAARWVREQEGLTLGERALLFTLATYVRDGVCWPSVGTLAEALEVDERSARRLVASCEAKGLVRRRLQVRQVGSGQRVNVLELPWALSPARTEGRTEGGTDVSSLWSGRGDRTVRKGGPYGPPNVEENDEENAQPPLAIVTDVRDARAARGAS